MSRTAVILAICLLTVAASAQATAQDGQADEATRTELARIRDEAIALDDAGRFALAAQRYLDLHAAMQRAGLPRAPVALWSAGLALTRVPGRERDARDTLQRFLDESTTLTDDAQIRDWRSTALEHIAELDARIGARSSEPDEGSGDATAAPPIAAVGATHVAGPIVLGIGGAAIVAGLITGGVALGADSTFSDMCPSRTNCSEETRASYDEARTFGAVSDALWIGGTVIAVTGLLLTLFLREGSEQVPTASAMCDEHGCIGSIAGGF